MTKSILRVIIFLRSVLLTILPKQKPHFLRVAYTYLFSLFCPSKIKVDGLELFINPKDTPDFFSSPFEKNETRIFKRVIRSDYFVLEGGANIGYHTLTFSKLAKEVWAFEPSREIFKYLQKNVSHNKIRNVKAVNKALSNRNGIDTLEMVDEHGKVLAGGSQRIGSKGGVETVSVVKADDLGIDFDFIKLDIEGHELKSLYGMERILKKKPIIFIEFHPKALRSAGEEPQNLLNFLIKKGYGVF